MSEEIKEILDRLENYDNYKYRNDNGLSYKEIEGWEIDLLLDHITNLQEKVDQYENPEDYTLFYMWLDEKAKDKMKELQEKNIKLKELCNKYEEEHKTTFIEWKKDIKANKKAIEYIEKYSIMYEQEVEPYKVIESEELLNILQGSDKE